MCALSVFKNANNRPVRLSRDLGFARGRQLEEVREERMASASMRLERGSDKRKMTSHSAGIASLVFLLMQRLTTGGKNGFMHRFRKRRMSKDHR